MHNLRSCFYCCCLCLAVVFVCLHSALDSCRGFAISLHSGHCCCHYRWFWFISTSVEVVSFSQSSPLASCNQHHEVGRVSLWAPFAHAQSMQSIGVWITHGAINGLVSQSHSLSWVTGVTEWGDWRKKIFTILFLYQTDLNNIFWNKLCLKRVQELFRDALLLAVRVHDVKEVGERHLSTLDNVIVNISEATEAGDVRD